MLVERAVSITGEYTHLIGALVGCNQVERAFAAEITQRKRRRDLGHVYICPCIQLALTISKQNCGCSCSAGGTLATCICHNDINVAIFVQITCGDLYRRKAHCVMGAFNKASIGLSEENSNLPGLAASCSTAVAGNNQISFSVFVQIGDCEGNGILRNRIGNTRQEGSITVAIHDGNVIVAVVEDEQVQFLVTIYVGQCGGNGPIAKGNSGAFPERTAGAAHEDRRRPAIGTISIASTKIRDDQVGMSVAIEITCDHRLYI